MNLENIGWKTPKYNSKTNPGAVRRFMFEFKDSKLYNQVLLLFISHKKRMKLSKKKKDEAKIVKVAVLQNCKRGSEETVVSPKRKRRSKNEVTLAPKMCKNSPKITDEDDYEEEKIFQSSQMWDAESIFHVKYIFK